MGDIRLASGQSTSDPALNLLATCAAEADRVAPSWSKATLKLDVSALLIPQSSDPATAHRFVALQVITIRITPQIKFGSLQLSLRHLFENAVAARILSSFADQLIIPVDLPADVSFSTKIASSQNQTFKAVNPRKL
ncbi:hypothetical protein QA649_36230 [Bradyrhizobium sp. CB1717]|uniref:hypothetical protein n=1 Tax=Bradyrhizobium sp. CB1717 TaxID=3039154 RepID=UPI0024B0D1E8|nr:hypothetical protein [Bradyrhizobium sp. CB1717]WFU23431.1 hypothetical protein QA649_36230 [Bradyrhizobium sp. CB1717]